MSTNPPSPEPSHALRELIERFTNHSRVQNFASSTITLRRQYLIRFATWCEERGVTQIDEITRDILQAYQRYLFHYRNLAGKATLPVTNLSVLICSSPLQVSDHNLTGHGPVTDLPRDVASTRKNGKPETDACVP